MFEWMIMPLKRYADFSGRSRRKEYWSFLLLNFIVYFVCIALIMAGGVSMAEMTNPGAAAASGPGFGFYLGFGIFAIYFLAILIPSLAVTIRRFHDRDMSGWFFLLFLVLSMIPFVGFLASLGMLVLMCLEGTRGPNKFGPDPKDPTSAEVFA